MRALVPRGSHLSIRIQALIARDANGCWNWQARIDREGYGHIRVAGKMQLAHRVSFETFRQMIPAGLTIDHLCKNTRCCNPDHLEPVTAAENARRSSRVAAQIRSAVCKHGHALSGSNVRVVNGTRYCRACDARRSREYLARRRGRS